MEIRIGKQRQTADVTATGIEGKEEKGYGTSDNE